MFRFFSSNQPYVIFFIPLLALVFLFPIILEPQLNLHFLVSGTFMKLFLVLSQNNFIIYLVSVIAVSMNAVLLHRITDKHGVFIKSNHIIPAIYILLIAVSPKLNSLLPLHFTSFFVLISVLRISNLHTIEKPYSSLFDCGLMVALASFFYLPSALLLVWVFITTVILKPFTWRDFLIPIMGFLLPYWFYAFYLFYFDITLENEFLFNPFFNRITLPTLIDILSFGLIIILISAAFISYFVHIQRKTVRVRNLYLSYLWLSIFIFLSIVIPNSNIRTSIGLIAIPYSILLTDFLFTLEKRKWLPELIILSIITLLLFNHIYINNLLPLK